MQSQFTQRKRPIDGGAVMLTNSGPLQPSGIGVAFGFESSHLCFKHSCLPDMFPVPLFAVCRSVQCLVLQAQCVKGQLTVVLSC
jgi:hypothetical protein